MKNSEYERCKRTLFAYGISESDIYLDEACFIQRKVSGLEVLGVIYSIYKFLKKIQPKLTIENSYELYSAQSSDGSFNMWEDLVLDDEFFVNSFFVSKNIVVANICNKEGYGVAHVTIREE